MQTMSEIELRRHQKDIDREVAHARRAQGILRTRMAALWHALQGWNQARAASRNAGSGILPAGGRPRPRY